MLQINPTLAFGARRGDKTRMPGTVEEIIRLRNDLPKLEIGDWEITAAKHAMPQWSPARLYQFGRLRDALRFEKDDVTGPNQLLVLYHRTSRACGGGFTGSARQLLQILQAEV